MWGDLDQLTEEMIKIFGPYYGTEGTTTNIVTALLELLDVRGELCIGGLLSRSPEVIIIETTLT